MSKGKMHAECMAEDTNVSVYVYNPHYIWTVQDQEKMSSGKRVFEAVKEVFIERQRHHFFFFLKVLMFDVLLIIPFNIIFECISPPLEIQVQRNNAKFISNFTHQPYSFTSP